MTTMSFAGYILVRCLLSVFPAFLGTCSGLTWFGSVYLITTAEFVADQLMLDKQQTTTTIPKYLIAVRICINILVIYGFEVRLC